MTNLGTKVSYISNNEGRSNGRVVPQAGHPILDTDLILAQDILDSKNRDLIRKNYHSGLLNTGEVFFFDGTINTEFSNVLRFKTQYVLVNGWLIRLGHGTNQIQTGSTSDVWTNLAGGDVDLNVFVLEEPPSLGARDDLVFLEIWEELLDTSSVIFPNGNTQYSGSNLTNDILHPDAGGAEISKRTQLRFKIRTAIGVDFFAFKQGLGHSSAVAQTSNPDPNLSYPFSPDTEDRGMWVAGDGSEAAINDLGSVDGKSYAIPLFRVHRRNKTGYSLTNLNGNSASISDAVSDRPDGLYHDGVYSQDVEDLRHIIKFNGIDFEKLATDNFSKLIENNLDTRIIQSSEADLAGVTLLQIDGISTTDRTGINDQDFRNPNGVQRVYSDAEFAQKHVLPINSVALSAGILDLSTSIPTPYNDNTLDPWAGSGLSTQRFPKVYEVNSGGLVNVAGDSSFGVNGWVDLDDRLRLGTLQFKPANPVDIDGKDIIIDFDLMWPANFGLTERINTMLKVTDDSVGEEVAATEHESGRENHTLENLRPIVGSFIDSATKGSINYFIDNSANENETYRGGTIEVSYFDSGNGTSVFTTPTSVYGHKVIGVFRVFNETLLLDAEIISLELQNDESYKLTFSGNIPTTQILRFTFLLAGSKIDWEGPTKAITDTAQTEILEFSIPANLSVFVDSGGMQYEHDTPTGNDTFRINLSKIGSTLSNVIAAMGFFKLSGTTETLDYQVFTEETSGFLRRTDVELSGFNTPFLVVKFTTSQGAFNDQGKRVKIPLLGLKPFASSVQLTAVYNYKPYRGITQEAQTSSTMVTEILHISNTTLVTSSGTGFNHKFSLTNRLKAVTSTLPINSVDDDSAFSGDDIEFEKLTNKLGSVKFVVGRDYEVDTNNPESLSLLEGAEMVVKRYTNTSELHNTRGAHLESPNISEGMPELLTEVVDDVSSQADGSNILFRLTKPVVSVNSTLVEGISTTMPVASVDLKVYVNKIEVAVSEIRGADLKIVLASAPSGGDEVLVFYNTAVPHMNVICGICRGLKEIKSDLTEKEFYPEELLLFTITTTSSTGHISTFVNSDESKIGTGNKVIFNNNVEIVTSPLNEANRVLGAVDFFRIANKPLIKNSI